MHKDLEKYRGQIEKVERSDPRWYLDIEHELYQTINNADDRGSLRCEICQNDETEISTAIFAEDDRIYKIIEILEEVNFKVNVQFDDYWGTTLVIAWDNSHRQIIYKDLEGMTKNEESLFNNSYCDYGNFMLGSV